MASEPLCPTDGAPTARVFACPNCGASLTLRAIGETKRVGCAHCGALVDVSDANYEVAEIITQKAPDPFLPLGAVGKFKGDKFEVIGFLVRKDGSGNYYWSEYLLYNPYRGFRWLVEYNGHWILYTTTKNKPENSGSSTIKHLGTKFKLFQEGKAVVEYVIGEFYWAIRKGETVNTADYVSPPYILSREGAIKDTVWSLGEYVPIEYLQEAFSASKNVPVPKTFPLRTGIHPAQPSPIKPWLTDLWGTFSTFAFVIIAIQILFAVRAQNRLVFSDRFEHRNKNVASDVLTRVTPEFIVAGHGNVEIDVYSDINNTWMGFDVNLIDKSTGQRYGGDVEIGYYSGFDSDGSWQEGTRKNSLSLPNIPAGLYYLTIDSTGEPASVGKYYQVSVYRDRVPWGPFWLALWWLFVVPGLIQLFHAFYEFRRWQDSDHPWLETTNE